MAVTVFVYDAFGKLVAEYASTPPARNGMQFLTADLLGSPQAVTGAAGNGAAGEVLCSQSGPIHLARPAAGERQPILPADMEPLRLC